jgi:cation diffusion facilitator CzcD-associated flavoprotein CzcO
MVGREFDREESLMLEQERDRDGGRMPAPKVDAVVIGAGLSGLRVLRELRDEVGLSVKVFEAGSDVGGTWFWNRYPGARTDTESWAYGLSFDKDLLEDWDWEERFPGQPEVERYLNHVADRFDLRKDIEFDTRVTSATFDEERTVWRVVTDGGETVTCSYLVTAAGLLSDTYEPPFPGIESFAGDWYQTSLWPEEPVEFEGKRVAVIGTGATAIQLIPEIAHQADHLTVFQRTPNYVVPARNHLLPETQRGELKRNYDTMWEELRKQPFALPIPTSGRVAADMPDPADRQRVFDAVWETGGFRFIFESFDDLIENQSINDEAAEFVRNKIRTIVKDPETAELLCPTTHPFGSKRLPLGHFYYETFNRDNVDLVGLRGNPIKEVTPKGILLEDGSEYEVDVIVFALGFNAITGALAAIDIRGRDGRSLGDKWADGASAYLGVAVDEFPNMFTILGPQSPFVNTPPMVERQVDFIGGAIRYMRAHDVEAMEATAATVAAWNAECRTGLDATLIPKGLDDRPWFLRKIPGKPLNVLFYFGGFEAYCNEVEASLDNDLAGFTLQSATRAEASIPTG